MDDPLGPSSDALRAIRVPVKSSAENGAKSFLRVRSNLTSDPAAPPPSASSIPAAGLGPRASVGQLKSEMIKLREEVKALQFLARRKEQEWDQIVMLLKKKEAALLKSEKAVAMSEPDPTTTNLMSCLIHNGSTPKGGRDSIVIPGSVGNSLELSLEDSNSSLPVISSVRTQPMTDAGAASSLATPPTPPPPASPAGILCQYCLKHVSKFMCAGCSNRWYCTKDCQIKDWDTHADLCS